jgi:hypothetical protein
MTEILKFNQIRVILRSSTQRDSEFQYFNLFFENSNFTALVNLLCFNNSNFSSMFLVFVNVKFILLELFAFFM